MKHTLDIQKTVAVLEKFYENCLDFWKREKENNQNNYNEEINPKFNAIKDIENISTNPFDPQGGTLNHEAKRQWIEKISK